MQKVLREMTAKHNAEINEESKRKEFRIGACCEWEFRRCGCKHIRRKSGLYANIEEGVVSKI